jgi:hypothetical protein
MHSPINNRKPPAPVTLYRGADELSLALARKIEAALYSREFPGGSVQRQAAMQVVIHDFFADGGFHA